MSSPGSGPSPQDQLPAQCESPFTSQPSSGHGGGCWCLGRSHPRAQLLTWAPPRWASMALCSSLPSDGRAAPAAGVVLGVSGGSSLFCVNVSLPLEDSVCQPPVRGLWPCCLEPGVSGQGLSVALTVGGALSKPAEGTLCRSRTAPELRTAS